MSPDTVAVHKYIMRRGKRGATIPAIHWQTVWESTQVPFTQEISSNFAPALVRKMTIKNRQYIIRRPVVEITEENAPVLQLLDCLKDLEKCTELEPEKCYYK